MRRFWFTNLLTAGLVGYAVAWFCLQFPGGYEALLVLVRAALISLLLVMLVTFFWWLLFIRRLRVKTLVVTGPLVVAMMAVPLPYYSYSQAVQQNLKQVGVRYQVKPVGFSQTLQNFARDLLCLDSSSELFATEPTWIEIDPSTVRQDQLDRIDNYKHLKAVVIQKRVPEKVLQPELAQWLNRLPETTRLDAYFEDSDTSDLTQLQAVVHPISTLSFARHKISAENACRAISVSPETLLFYEVQFAKDLHWQILAPKRLRDVQTLHVTQSKLTGSQLLALTQMTGCQTLTCDWLPNNLTVDECVMLAQLPNLTSVSFGDMPLSMDHLLPLAGSSQLKTFIVGSTRMSDEELLRLREAFPEGSNRRIRNHDGRTVQQGDVGRRRGP